MHSANSRKPLAELELPRVAISVASHLLLNFIGPTQLLPVFQYHCILRELYLIFYLSSLAWQMLPIHFHLEAFSLVPHWVLLHGHLIRFRETPSAPVLHSTTPLTHSSIGIVAWTSSFILQYRHHSSRCLSSLSLVVKSHCHFLHVENSSRSFVRTYCVQNKTSSSTPTTALYAIV